MMFEFQTLSLLWDGRQRWWLSFLYIDDMDDGPGSFFHIENDYGHWKFDLLWYTYWKKYLRKDDE